MCVRMLRVHLAALAFVAHGGANDFYHVNVIGTRNLLTALTHGDATPECVVLWPAVPPHMAMHPKGSWTSLFEPAPTSLIMQSANFLWSMPLACGVSVYRWWLPDRLITQGLGRQILFLSPKIVAHFCLRSQHIELGNLDVQRDFSDVRSVVQAYRRLIETINAVGKQSTYVLVCCLFPA